METRKLPIITVIVCLFMGATVGYGAGYAIYKPQIDKCETDVLTLSLDLENVRKELSDLRAEYTALLRRYRELEAEHKAVITEEVEVSVSSDSILLRVELEKTVYQVGEPVKIILTLTNTGDIGLTLTFPTSQKFDFRVLDREAEVYQWSKDKMFLQALTSITLESGEGLSQTFIWNQKDNQGNQVSTGLYSIGGFTAQFEYEGKQVILQSPIIEIEII